LWEISFMRDEINISMHPFAGAKAGYEGLPTLGQRDPTPPWALPDTQ
jgi:hypothetical protein